MHYLPGLGMGGAAFEGCSLNTSWLPARAAGLTLLVLLQSVCNRETASPACAGQRAQVWRVQHR